MRSRGNVPSWSRPVSSSAPERCEAHRADTLANGQSPTRGSWCTWSPRSIGTEAACSASPEAQAVLERFLPRFNARFRVPAAEAKVAYRPLDPNLPLASVLSFRHARTVARDNTVKYRWRTLQLPPPAPGTGESARPHAAVPAAAHRSRVEPRAIRVSHRSTHPPRSMRGRQAALGRLPTTLGGIHRLDDSAAHEGVRRTYATHRRGWPGRTCRCCSAQRRP